MRVLVTGIAMEKALNVLAPIVLTMNRPHKPNGDFARVHEQWSLENFDDGYVDAYGRFRVYFPSHPTAYKEGYVLRARVAFEAYHNLAIPDGMDIHHIDENRLNDSKENLALVPHGIHSGISNQGKGHPSMTFICKCCGTKFELEWGRVNSKNGHRRGKYCSQKCYQKSRKKQT